MNPAEMDSYAEKLERIAKDYHDGNFEKNNKSKNYLTREAVINGLLNAIKKNTRIPILNLMLVFKYVVIISRF